MDEAITAHSSNIEEWADEWRLVIPAPKSTITIFTPQQPFLSHSEQLITTPWNNSLFTKNDFPPSLQIQCSYLIYSHPEFTLYHHPQGPWWYQLGQQKETILITYMSLIRWIHDPLIPLDWKIKTKIVSSNIFLPIWKETSVTYERKQSYGRYMTVWKETPADISWCKDNDQSSMDSWSVVPEFLPEKMSRTYNPSKRLTILSITGTSLVVH